jgi:hypothetical protein
MDDGLNSSSSRWVTIHSRNHECKAAHSAAITLLKAHHSSHVSPVESSTSAVYAPPPLPIVDPTITETSVLDAFWNSAKMKQDRREVMGRVEQNAEALATLCDSDEEEPYVFSGKDLLLQLIDTAVGNTREIKKQGDKIQHLEDTVDLHAGRIAQLEATVADLRAQLKQMAESYHALKHIHDQCVDPDER